MRHRIPWKHRRAPLGYCDIHSLSKEAASRLVMCKRQRASHLLSSLNSAAQAHSNSLASAEVLGEVGAQHSWMRATRLLLHTQPLEAGFFQEMAVYMEERLAEVGKMPTDLQSTMTLPNSGNKLNSKRKKTFLRWFMAKLFVQEHKLQRLSYFPSLLSGETHKLLTICQKLYFPTV